MGFRICYIGGNCPPEDLAAHMQMDVDGSTAEMPFGESWVAKIKESGWSVLWSEDETFVESNSSLISKASQSIDLISCEVNETCMWSSAEFLRDGKSVWKVTHAGDGEDIFDLSEHGTLPTEFEKLKTEHFDNQKVDVGCDHIFEIPLDTASFFLKFRHDQYLDPTSVDQFRILKEKKRPSFFGSLLGRN